MQIRQMFAEDINRKINGVIKVDQQDDSTEREIQEYVITKELKKHFITFFNYYGDAFAEPTDDIGVWISGFFGSGKSHFLKMLSYLLENREINGVKTVERFRQKFAEDPATFMLVDAATRTNAETILFNIDIEGSINKDKTAVLRVFAKMFYSHLGFYGENLKVAMLERYIDQIGKTEEFRRVFEQKKGMSWLKTRRAFAFNGKAIIPTLMEVLEMSEEDARQWFNDKSSTELSIAQLVGDIKEYVNRKPRDFRLLFMVDEVGQYVGTDQDMLLNLQSLLEKIGSECGGKVWVVCTGQEALDEIIKVRADEFSRILARFRTRLSLSSSSVDEVIQKRILKKTPAAAAQLRALYAQNDSVLRNLFSFTDSVLDIKGYGGEAEFCEDFPFVPYQFIIMQKVFSEIRKHGNAGKHLSGGERSMLSGFQEAAQKLQTRDEYTLVPFFCFYDTVHSFLDSSIRRVIERCERAAADGSGLQPQDTETLKLLYLVRYIDDIKPNLDNLTILTADDIRADKILLRERVKASLDRLISQNYIARNGDAYAFLTDEEQDIQREINNIALDGSDVLRKIAGIIFGSIYPIPKYRYGRYDFAFDRMVDSVSVGAVTGGMKLRFLTLAADAAEKSELRLLTGSAGSVLVVLADTPYYETLERAIKIDKYVKRRNVAQLPRTVQEIIRARRDEGDRYEQEGAAALAAAIEGAAFYADGERIEIRAGGAKARLDQAMEYLVAHVYSELGLITRNADSDADIAAVLNGSADDGVLPGMEDNRAAAAKMEEYLEMQALKNLRTSMRDVQNRYQAIPYGWREIDIACVAARLVYEQKAAVQYAGETIRADNPRLPGLLRLKSEIDKTLIAQKQRISAGKLKKAREFLREYLDRMDLPEDEDGLIRFIIQSFAAQKEHFAALDARYEDGQYPDRPLLQNALTLVSNLLAQQRDNTALIDHILRHAEELLDSKEELQNLESFFKNQVQLFDAAVRLEAGLRSDLDQLVRQPDANQALGQIRLILTPPGRFDYRRIPELNGLMDTVRAGHGQLLQEKRGELLELVRQCMAQIHTAAPAGSDAERVSKKADEFYAQKKQQIAGLESLALLDGLSLSLFQYKDEALSAIEALQRPADPPVRGGSQTPDSQKIIRPFHRLAVFPAKRLESAAEIDAYLENARRQLNQLLQSCNGIQLK